MNELDKKLDAAMNEAMETVSAPLVREPVPLRKSITLSDQMNQLQRVETELLQRLRKEAVEAECQREQKISEAQTDYRRKLAEVTDRLESARDEAILLAHDDYHAKLHDLERLLRRRPAGGL